MIQTKAPAAGVPAMRTGSRAALRGGVALAALAVCSLRTPARAGNTAVVINSTPSGSTYTNSGTIQGKINGIAFNAPVNTVTNTGTGTISGGGSSGNALVLYANVGTLTNSGTLTAPIAVQNWFGSIGSFANSGKVIGYGDKSGYLGTGVANEDGIGVLTNSGTIQGNTWGVWNVDYGSGFGSIDNSGTIVGAVSGLINTNRIGTLTNSGVIQNTGYSRSTGIWGVTAAIWNYGAAESASIGTLTNSGTITGPQFGIANEGSTYTTLKEKYVYTADIGTIGNSGTIYGGKYGIYNTYLGTIGGLTNSGKILANQAGIYNGSTFGNIVNQATGTISGGQGPYGIYNSSSMGSIDNYGTIGAQQYGLYNSGTAGALTNYAGATITGGNGTFGVYNTGTLGTVSNGGLIIAAGTAFYNAGRMSGLVNTGTITSLYNAGGRITGGSSGISNTRQISALTNTGSISGTVYGVNNIGAEASISALANLASGIIKGTNTGIYNTGSIGTLSNSGVISGSLNAINSAYVLTNILNSGTIDGNISIFPATSAPYQSYITITGATTNAIGTLTGGNISTGIGNLTLVQNNLLMDDVYLPASSATGVGKLVNYGQLSLVTNQTIYGNFKNSGTLLLASGATLTVTGEWTDPPASSTGAVYLQAANGDASPVGSVVIARSAAPVDAALATVDGIGYSVSGIRTVSGPGGTYLLVADVARSDYVFRQDGALVVSGLAGTRSLLQAGGGSTYLLGANPYSGATTVTDGVLGIVGTALSPHYAVSGGTLRVDGVASGSVLVGPGGTLQGSGMFGGGTIGAGGIIAPSNIAAVTALAAARDPAAAAAALGVRTSYGAGAAVSLANAGGNLVSNGNLVLAAGSTYRVGVAASGQSDHLVVNGRAVLQGGAVEVRALPGSYGAKTAYTILDASGGVSGSFGSVTSDLAFLTPTLTYDQAEVYLTLRRNDVPFTGVAATQNQRAVAAGLQGSFRNSLSPAGGAVIDTLTAASAPQAQAMLDEISGEGLAAAQSASFGAITSFAGAVRSQAMERVTGTLPSPPAKGAAPAERWRSWAAAIGGGGSMDGNSSVGAASVSVSGGGGVAGIEFEVDPHLVLGLAGGGSASSFSVQERATSGTQTGGIGAVYGVGRFGHLYAIGLLGYGGFSTDTTRWLAGPSGTEEARGTLSGNAWSGWLEIGYRLENATVNIAPYVALQGTSLRSAGFTETSTTVSGQPGDLALRVQGGESSSVPGSIGFQLDRRFDIRGDWMVRPVLRLAWTHEFSTARDVAAGLVALPASRWTVQGASVPANAADIHLSVQALNRHGLALTAGFSAYAAPQATAYQGQLGVSYTW
jgi:outer membrane autotransporter protein